MALPNTRSEILKRYDPTGTYLIRRKYRGEFWRRWRKISGDYRRAVAADEFGHSNDVLPRSRVVDRMLVWLERSMDAELLSGEWQTKFVRGAYLSGLAVALNAAKRAGVPRASGIMSVEQLLDMPRLRDVYEAQLGWHRRELRGITQSVLQRVQRDLTRIVVQQEKEKKVVSAAADEGLTRSRTLAETGTTKSKAAGTVFAGDEFGALGFRLIAEFTTMQDDKVCPECLALAGSIYTLDSAMEDEIIPVHPNCRCTWDVYYD